MKMSVEMRLKRSETIIDCLKLFYPDKVRRIEALVDSAISPSQNEQAEFALPKEAQNG